MSRRPWIVVAALAATAAVIVSGYWLIRPVLEPPAPRPKPVTFGDMMHPAKAGVVDPDEASVTYRARRPHWGKRVRIGWDDEDAFTYALAPMAFGSFGHRDEAHVGGAGFDAAEFYLNNAVPKNADVTFTVTGRRFAIRYVTVGRSDSMVWIDGSPASTKPFSSVEASGKGTDDWIVVTMPEVRTVQVRFAGPFYFSGVEFPADEEVSVLARPPTFTLGVVSDSYYETSLDKESMSMSAAPTLATITGFRVWNMAQGGTGYLNNGDDPVGESFRGIAGTTRYGSSERMTALENAPIDALLVNGSINDGPPFSLAEHRRAVDQYLRQVEARFPTLPVVLVGLEPVSTSVLPDQPASPFDEMNQTLEDMAAEYENVVGFVDPYTANWLTGTGSTREPRGDGNQDRFIGRDGIHLNGAGQEFYQRRIVEELSRLPVDPLNSGLAAG